MGSRMKEEPSSYSPNSLPLITSCVASPPSSGMECGDSLTRAESWSLTAGFKSQLPSFQTDEPGSTLMDERREIVPGNVRGGLGFRSWGGPGAKKRAVEEHGQDGEA